MIESAMSTATIERFLNTDLAEIEDEFLVGRTITDLPVYVDEDRVPPQGRPDLDRVVNVDREVERFLAARKAAKAPRLPSLCHAITWLLRA